MLSADSIIFEQLPAYNYSGSSDSDISIELDQTNFLALAKMNPGSSAVGKDLVTIDKTTGTINVFMNSGNATNPYGNAPITTPISSVGGANKYFAIADMNKDNIPDLIIVCENKGLTGLSELQAEIYKGKSDGSFERTNTTSILATPFTTIDGKSIRIKDIQVRDITGDGISDLFVAVEGTDRPDDNSANNVTETRYFYYAGASSGFNGTANRVAQNYSTETPIGFGRVTASQSNLQLFTEVINVVDTNLNQQNVYAYSYNTSTNAATDAGMIKYSNATPNWTEFVNVDADVQDEIVSGIVYLNNENVLSYGLRVSQVTTLGTSHTGSIGMTPSTARVVSLDIEPVYCTFGDINGDGNSDIIVSDGTSYQILIGSKTGTADASKGVYDIGNYFYTVQSKVDTYINYLATQVGDFTGDGYQDVIAIGEKHALLLPGNPSHAAYETGVVLVEFPVKATNAVFGNFTGHTNDLTDFVISSGVEGTTIFLYQGVINDAAPGKETLFKEKAKHSIVTPGAMTAGHFISPSTGSQVDLAILRGGGNEIKVLSFTGERFGVERTIALGNTYAVDITAGDFNNDKYDDILIANGLYGNVRLCENTPSSPGSFTIHNIAVGSSYVSSTGTGSNIVTVAVADINGDGKLDFGVLDLNMNANVADHRMIFYTQTGNLTFSSTLDGKSNTISLPKMKDGVYEYHIIFEDFDLDGRPDVIVGLTDSAGDNQIVVYQNNGSSAGQFGSTPSWLTSTPISGTIDRKTSWGITTGYKNGLMSSFATPGVVVVSGNSVYRITNKTEADTSLGTVTVLLRDSATPLDSRQYGDSAFAALSQYDWLNEWGTYYLEVWGNTATNTDGIMSFSCSLNYDPTLFLVNSSSIASANFDLDSKTVGSNVISVTGSTSNTNYGKDQHVLLFRVLVQPATNTVSSGKENVGVFIPESGYAVPVSSGFNFSVAPQINGKNVMDANGAESVPVYPVIYDVDDNGRVDLTDFAAFIKAYNKSVTTYPEFTLYDFDHNGRVDLNDFALFIKVYNLTRSRGLQNTSLAFTRNTNFPELWPQLPQGAEVPQAAAALTALELEKSFTPLETETEFTGFLETMAADVPYVAAVLSTEIEITEELPLETETQIEIASLAPIAMESFVIRRDSLAELDTVGLLGARTRQERFELQSPDRFDRVLGDFYNDEFSLQEEDDDEIDFTLDTFETPQLQDRVLLELLA